jgi:thiamine-monophosphate kinase
MPAATRRPGRALREFELIRDIQRRFGLIGRAVVRGIGDDTAVLRPAKTDDLLVTTDLLTEGIHFDLATAAIEDVGYKAAVANLSDIAAMGGTPTYLLVALAIPRSLSSTAITNLYTGLMKACRVHGVQLVGGDTSASRTGLFLSLTLLGYARKGTALTRDGAAVGDDLYVTGSLGDARAGLEILSGRRRGRGTGQANGYPARDAKYLIARHLRPTPRIEEGRRLAAGGLASAAIDLSDGLAGDVAHVCEQSRVGVEVNPVALPVSPACRAYANASGQDPVALALAGGEDYELLFTAPARARARLARLADRHGFHFTRIGVIRPRAFGRRLRTSDGLRPMPAASYEHFRS